MRLLFQSRAGRWAVLVFIGMMIFAIQRVLARRHAREATIASTTLAATSHPAPGPGSVKRVDPGAGLGQHAALTENAAYLDRYFELSKGVREERDRQGNPLTRRESASTPSAAGRTTVNETSVTTPVVSARTTLRLQGQPAAPRSLRESSARERTDGNPGGPPAVAAATVASDETAPAPAELARNRPQRFNPYGRVLKCELVFTIDSTNEQTPLVGVVMEPVYNNGVLVVPAGAELHGVARPDRLRDRIFSGQEWVLVFPRAPGRPNGRQLTVRGVALDRVEPDANGMTWGLTDGSYGLAGKVIRTLDGQEIKRFAATFLAASAVALQERQSDRLGQKAVSNTPQNAALQGVAANLQQIAEDIAAEIAEHGVFIRVPAGHQFYFYPMQIIDPDAADISQNIATAQ